MGQQRLLLQAFLLCFGTFAGIQGTLVVYGSNLVVCRKITQNKVFRWLFKKAF
jgi:hypothetical protein